MLLVAVPVLSSALRFLSIHVLLLCFLTLCFAQDPPKTADSSVTPLELNKPIEREVKAREKQSYSLKIDSGQLATITIKQISTFVRVFTQKPDGQIVRVIDIPERTKPEVKFDTISDATGTYQFDVAGSMTVPTGRYEITLLSIRPATNDEIDIQKARRLKDRFFALQYSGKYNEARPFLIGSIEIYERIYGKDAEVVAVLLSSLGTNYHLTGDYVRAVESYQRSIGIFEKQKGIDHPYVAAELQKLGQVYVWKGETDKAKDSYSRAIQIYEKANMMETVEGASVIEDLADLYYLLDDYKNAEALFERAGSIWEKVVGPEHFHTASVITSLGSIAHETGDLPKAEKMLLRAVKVSEKTFASTPHRIASALNELGSLYITMGDFAKAEQTYRRSLSSVEKTESVNLEGALFGLARLYWVQGNASEAVKFARRGIAIENRILDVNLASGTEQEKLALLDEAAGDTFAIVSMQADLADMDGEVTNLAVSTILQRKGRVHDAMADSLSAVYERLGPDKKPLIEEYRNVTSELTNAILEGPEDKPPAEHEAEVKAIEARRGKLEAEIGKLTAGYFEVSPAVTVSEVQSRIPDDAALVEFFFYRPYDPKLPGNGKAYGSARYAVYVVRPTGEIGWADLGPVKDIDVSVNALRDALRDPKRKDAIGLARAVDGKVMAAVRRLADGAVHLLVAPDGELNLIPFEALIDEDGKYLIEKYSFTYLTSGRDLKRMSVRRESHAQPMIVADPLFGEPDGTAENSSGRRQTLRARRKPAVTYARGMSDAYFAQLAGTGAEASSIKSLFPNAILLSGQNATEESIKRTDAPQMLHIATHGFFLPDRTGNSDGGSRSTMKTRRNIENPMTRSGLAFAGANIRSTRGDDGILTALEASNLNLWGTRLVVLSACDTGLGEVRNGEGVYGLRRAFVIAGAESLVMSLWPVSDYVTRELMTGYYKNLKQGIGRGESLRRVQIEMLKRPNRRHPFYWASFIQSGEWANLDGKR